ncbi:helix-turn-helix domain-containing protein, partial (plasmid) [Synechococcus elongatus PCC 11802]
MQVHLYNMREWSPTETRVLFFMLATCDQGNMVHSTSGEIREVLDVTGAQLSKAIAGLVEKNLIVKCRFVGRSFFFMVNPAYFRRFEEKMLPAYLREYQQAKVIMQEREGLP